jgi:hypothetical protein
MVPEDSPELAELFDDAQAAREQITDELSGYQEVDAAGEPVVVPISEHNLRLGGPMQYDQTSDGKLQVRGCQSCGNYHESVTFSALAKPLSPYTHHFACPNTGDPVLLALMQGPNGIVDVNVEVLSHLVLAQSTGKYMVCVWRVEGDQVKYNRVTSDFPTADFDVAIKQLRESVDHELGRTRRKLPVASPRAPLGPIFQGLKGVAGKVLPAGQAVMPPLRTED